MSNKHTQKMNRLISGPLGKVMFGFCCFVLIILSLLLVIFLPDIIINLRLLLSSIFNIKCVEITDTSSIDAATYLDLMLNIISCLVAAVIAIIAHNLSKKLGKIQIQTQTAQQIAWASGLADMLKLNFGILFKTKTQKYPPNGLDLEASYSLDAINMYTAELISESDLEMLDECLVSFRQISKLWSSDNNRAIAIMDNITSQHINISGTELQFKGSMKNLLHALETISKEDT